MKQLLIIFLAIINLNLAAQTFVELDTLLGVVTDSTFTPVNNNGISFIDFNQDGYDDLTFATGNGYPPLFFENKIDHFERVEFYGINHSQTGRQISWIDVENDGDLDLFICSLNWPNSLYLNDGNFNFTESTFVMGLQILQRNTYGATFADINKDGFLDLYVSNLNAPNELYVYNNEQSKYNDITISSGASNGSQLTFSTTFADYDFDGDLDFYLCNDGLSNLNALYQNNGNLTFTDVGDSLGANVSAWAMNTGTGDYNNDGYWDIYVTNIGNSLLLTGSSNGVFTDNAINANITFGRFGWAANWLDVNNDGWEDIYVSGQSVNENAPNALYINNKNGSFTEPMFAFQGIGGNDYNPSYVNSIGDFNNDGKLDIANARNGLIALKLFGNYEENDNKFIKLKFEGVQSNIHGIGVFVEVWTNGNKRIFQTHSSNAFMSQNTSILHIGFEDQIVMDSLLVKWPFANNVDVIPGSNFMENNLHHIEEGSGITAFQNLMLCKDSMQVIIDPIPSQVYGSQFVTQSASVIKSGYAVNFKSQNLITLNAGFEVEAGGSFVGEIDICQ